MLVCKKVQVLNPEFYFIRLTGAKKKGKSTPKSDFSRQVTPEGFEPPTDGAEIRYSIQLNYGAIL